MQFHKKNVFNKKIYLNSYFTNLVARLWKLMKDRENIGPSAKLTELFNSIPSNGDLSHGEMIEKRVKDLGEIFISKYTTPNVDHPGSHEPIARKRLQMGESLYYKNLGIVIHNSNQGRQYMIHISSENIQSACGEYM